MDHENAKQRIRPRQLATAAPPRTSLASLLLPAPWKKLPHDFPIVRDQLLRKLHGHHAQYTERSTKRQIIRLTLMGVRPPFLADFSFKEINGNWAGGPAHGL